MFPLFTNLALLGGLAAIAAPILIHLLLRRKSQRLRFSSIQFFLKQDEQSMRRRKLRNLLLLATRVLLFVLLVLAFARPYLPNQVGGNGAQNRRQLILLLDTSASMQASGTGGSQWTRALERARAELAKLRKDDLVAVVTCSTRSDLLSEFAPATAILKKLEGLEPTFGLARLNEGLKQVAKVLPTADPAFPTELCIISDLQRGTSDNLANTPLPPELAVRFIDLGERLIPNIAVSRLQLEPSQEAGPHATLTSFSDESLEALPYTLKIDGREVFDGSLAMAAGAMTNLPLAIPSLKPGWHSAEFVVQAKDGLTADNVSFATIYVPPPVHGLIVEPRVVPEVFREESYFVGTALNPRLDGDAASSRFSFEKIRLNELPQKILPQAGRPNVDFVLIPAVDGFPAPVVSALNSFVRKGGGLMLFVGESTSAIGYTSLGELLPARLGNDEMIGEEALGWRVGHYDKSHPTLAIFGGANSGNLFIPEFTRRFGLKPLPGARTIAEFEDGTPLILTRQVGAGRVLLVNSSADVAWNDWPKHKTFVPWLHSSALHLSDRDELHEKEPLPLYASGSEVDVDLAGEVPSGVTNIAARQMFSFQHSDSNPINVTADERGVLQSLSLSKPGISTLKDAQGVELRRFAANLPALESDLTHLAPPEAEQQLVRASDSGQAVLAAGLFDDARRGRELWRPLLLAALALLLLEPILANRISA